MKKKIISLSIVIITLLTIFMCPTTMAVGDLISIGKPQPSALISDEKTGVLIGTLKWIGYVVAIGMIMWSGIKYVMSGAGEKAKVKETLVPIVIGAILVVAAVEITGAVFGTFEQ